MKPPRQIDSLIDLPMPDWSRLIDLLTALNKVFGIQRFPGPVNQVK